MIGIVLDHSGDLVFLFLIAQVVLISVLVPFAMGLWGVFLHGYSDAGRALNSILMIMFAKGAFAELNDYNPQFTFVFLLLYYATIMFIMHAGFHKVQGDSLRLMTARYGLQKPFFEEKGWQEEQEKYTPKQLRRLRREVAKGRLDQLAKLALWLTACLESRRVARAIVELKDKLITGTAGDSDSSDDEEAANADASESAEPNAVRAMQGVKRQGQNKTVTFGGEESA